MAKPCTPHLIAQRVQLFKLQARNVNFLWEGVREGYLFLKKRYPSLIRIPCAAQGMDAALCAANYRFPYGKIHQPGGQVMSRPASTWKCRCGTLCPACSPMLDTTR